MADPVTRGIFDGLVRRAGGVEAVAAVLEARYGVGCKGTVSKMCSGQLGVTVDAAIAVEDFVGAFPLSNRMFERTASGQAHSTLIRAFSHLSPGGENLTVEERAEVIAHMRAARQVLTDIIEAAEVAE
jgi:hypothetical protein